MGRGRSQLEIELQIGAVLTVLIVVAGVAIFVWKTAWYLDANEIGDFVAGFFSSLVAVWMVVATLLQRRELQLQRQEIADLKDATKTQSEATRAMAFEESADSIRGQFRNWLGINRERLIIVYSKAKRGLMHGLTVQRVRENYSKVQGVTLDAEGEFGIKAINPDTIVLEVGCGYSGAPRHPSSFKSTFEVSALEALGFSGQTGFAEWLAAQLTTPHAHGLIEIIKRARDLGIDAELVRQLEMSSKEGFVVLSFLWSRGLLPRIFVSERI